MTGHRLGAVRWWAFAAAAMVLVVGCSNASIPSPPSPGGSSAPGVSARQINVGAVATLSGGVAADFGPIVPGVRAYLDMVNAKGGVNGRQVVLANAVDDSTFNNQQAVRTIVEQDHVFAVVGVATAFFTGQPFLVQTGTPTFGFATEDNWSPAPNLFAAYGSVIDFANSEPFFPYLARRVHAQVAAVIAYGVPQSATECRGAVDGLERYGVPVGYSDLAVPVGSSLSSDVVHMKQAGVDFVVSCMDVPGNLDLSRTIQQNGLTGVKQVWLDGYDLSTLHQYPTLMNNVYFLVQHVPFQAASQFPGEFPGLSRYIETMNRYEPGYTFNEVAMEGWLSGALFVAGLRAAGPSLTQQRLISAINHITSFTAGGVIAPVDWSIAHTRTTSPSCETFVLAQAGAFKVVFNHGRHIWVCFPLTARPDIGHPVAAPRGTPGA